MPGIRGKKMWLNVMAMLLGVSAPAEVHAQGETIAPTGKWVVSYDETSCSLGRTYGDITLAIRQVPVGRTFDLIIAQPKRGAGDETGLAQITLDDGRALIEARYQRWSDKDAGQTISNFAIDIASLDDLASASKIRVDKGASIPLAFGIINAKPAFGALKKCYDDLLPAVGLDVGKLERVKTLPKYIPRQISGVVYPPDALKRGIGGDVRVLFRIDAKGRPQDCRIIKGSGYPSLDEASCRSLTSGLRYRPALDAAGQPIETWEGSAVRWRVPR